MLSHALLILSHRLLQSPSLRCSCEFMFAQWDAQTSAVAGLGKAITFHCSNHHDGFCLVKTALRRSMSMSVTPFQISIDSAVGKHFYNASLGRCDDRVRIRWIVSRSLFKFLLSRIKRQSISKNNISVSYFLSCESE